VFFNAKENRQHVVLYSETVVVHDFAIADTKYTIISAPYDGAVLEPSGAVWGTNDGHAGYFRIDINGIVNATVGKAEDPVWFQLVPGGGFAGARVAVVEANACDPLLTSRVWRWTADGALSWTAADCKGAVPGPLERLELSRLAVDGRGDVIVAGTAIAADGLTPTGLTLMKLEGTTGARLWQTSIEPGPGYDGTILDVLQIGSDDSIFLSGREGGPASDSDTWIRRIHP
jgi:hypothetical protein